MFAASKSGSSGATSDSSFPYVPLLLETTASSSRSTTVADSSAAPLAITRNGTPSTGWTSPYQTEGYWSYYVSNTSYLSLTLAASNVIFPSTNGGGITIEFWVNVAATSATFYSAVVSAVTYSIGEAWWELGCTNTGITLTFGSYGYSSANMTSSTPFVPGQWTHVVVQRRSNGTNWDFFQNGVNTAPNIAGVGYNSNFYNPTSPIRFGIGASGNTGCYVSNFRIINNSALYPTTGFTPPTAPLTIVSGTVLLTCQSNRFKDNGPSNVAITGTSSPQTTSYYPSGFTAPADSPGAAYFGVANTDYLSPASASALAFGNNAYTVEFWVFMASYTTGDNRVIDLGNANNSFAVSIGNTAKVSVAKYGAVNILDSSASFVLGQWNHVAVVRTSSATNGLAIYLNGKNIGTGTDSNNWTVVTTPRINGLTGFSMGWVGYLSNLRIVNGTAIYTGEFTPPTGFLTQTGGTYSGTTNVNTSFAASSTSLLVNFADSNYTSATNGVQNNTFIDTGPYAFSITRNGTATQGSVTPYWPTGYWSNYFGTTTSDNIYAASNAAFAVGTNNFTVEFWANWTAWASTNQRMILMGQSGLSPIEISRDSAANVLNIYTNAGSAKIAYTWTPTLGTWYHIAVVRSGTGTNQLILYINGTNVGTGTSADSIAANNFFVGGLNWATGYNMQGYISNVRFVNGTAVYTANFAPPTTPLTATQTSNGSAIQAILGTATALLTCQSNRFRDSSNNFAITANGTPQSRTFQPFSPTAAYTPALYGGSGYFNGSTDLLTLASNAAFGFGTGGFTVEFWIYPLVTANTWSIYHGTATNAFIINTSSTGQVIARSYGVADLLTTTATLAVNAWTHLAVTRSGTTLTIWLNGVSSGTVTNSTNFATTGLYIGQADSATALVNGYISDLRVVKGVAVYTANFTPPTVPVTAIANTSLLLNFTNAAIYDATTQNNQITVGSAQASTTVSKWTPTSIKFNGSTDRLTIPYNRAFSLTSQNFTIEFWIYFGSVASGQTIVRQDSNATQKNWAIYTGSTGTLSYYLSSNGTSFDIANGVTVGSIAINTWYHVALVRNGSTFTPYLNGAAGTTTTSSSALFASTSNISIGSNPTSIEWFNGYIQDFRISNNIVRYTTAVGTPPAAALTPLNNTVLLLKPDYAPSTRSTVVADSGTANGGVGFTVTRAGSSLSTGWVSPYQTDGYWGNYLNNNSAYLTFPLITLGSIFTVEGWFYTTAINSGASNVIVSNRAQDGGTKWLGYFSDKLRFSYGGTDRDFATTINANTWYHFAFVITSSTVTCYLNGVQIGTTQAAPTSLTLDTISGYGTGGMTGYLSNFRIVNGVAVYTGVFTPPTTPLQKTQSSGTNISAITGSQTSLLTCQSNRFIDNSNGANAITVSGTPQVTPYYYPSTFTAPAASIGSGYFGGSDYLTVPHNTALNMSSSDFTIEGWYYPMGNATAGVGIVSKRANNGTVGGVLLYYGSTGLTPSLLVDIGGTWAINTASTIAFKSYQWNHFAIVRNGSAFNLYVNGVSGISATNASAVRDNSDAFVIGADGASGQAPINTCYISNVRVVKGTAVYTSAFTPPSTLLTPITNTSLLVNLADTNYTSVTNAGQNNTFIDDSNYAWPITRNGTATQGSFTPYWPNGYWSNYFNGSSYIRSPGFNFSTNDFTIECFLNTAILSAGPQFLGGYDAAGQNYTIAMNAGGVLGYFLSSDGSTWNIASNQTLGTVVANRWHHIVIARTGNKIRSYFDGVGGTVITTSAAIYNNATNFWLGAAGSVGGNLTGYLSNVRILNGTSAYDANQSTITVPTAPFATGTTNQVLLTCQGNRFLDVNTATTAKTITVTGTPKIQVFQPFALPTYTPATYGGSGYFSGSGDYLTSSYNINWYTFGSYTLEFWVYHTALAASLQAYAGTGSTGYTSFYVYSSGSIGMGVSGSTEVASATGIIKTNTWHHIAYTYNGTTTTIYVNGASVASSTSSNLHSNNSAALQIASGLSSVPVYGYVSNFRITKSVVYTGAFTPPATPVTAITNTSLLLNFANAAIYDSSAQNNYITNGSTQASTTVVKWSPNSMKFNGTTDFLSSPVIPTYSFGTGDFTIEGWFYFSAFNSAGGGDHFLITLGTGYNAGGPYNAWGLRYNASAYGNAVIQLSRYNGTEYSVNFSLPSANYFVINTWYHIACARSGTNLCMFLNGAQVGNTVTNSTDFSAVNTDPLQVGKAITGAGTYYHNGYMQDVRVTNGVARYTPAAFTLPTAAFQMR